MLYTALGGLLFVIAGRRISPDPAHKQSVNARTIVACVIALALTIIGLFIALGGFDYFWFFLQSIVPFLPVGISPPPAWPILLAALPLLALRKHVKSSIQEQSLVSGIILIVGAVCTTAATLEFELLHSMFYSIPGIVLLIGFKYSKGTAQVSGTA